MTAFDTTEPDDGISTAQTVALDFYSDSAWMLGTRDVRLQAGDEDWSRIEAVAHGRYCVTADRGYPVSHRFFGMDSAALPPVQFFDNPDFVCAEAQANGPIFVRTVALETGTESKPIEEFLVFGQLFKDGGIATAQTVSLSEATDGSDGYGLRDVLLHAGEVEWSRIETVANGRYCVSNPGDPVSHSFFVDKNSVALPLLQDAPPGALCAEALEDGPIFVRTVALVTGTQTIAVNLLFWQLFKDDGITKAQTVALEDSADRHWGFGSRYVELHVRDVEWSRIEAVAHGKYCVSNTDDQVSHRFFDKDSVALPSLQNSPSDAVCAEALANGPIFVRTVTALETGMTMSFLPFWRLPEPYDENFKIQIP